MNLVNFRKQNGKNNGAFYLLLLELLKIVNTVVLFIQQILLHVGKIQSKFVLYLLIVCYSDILV